MQTTHSGRGDARSGICMKLQNSDITVFSFYSEIGTTGEGRMALKNLGKIRKKLNMLRSHSINKDISMLEKRQTRLVLRTTTT